jgi:DNA-directed RNA polymerase specialized sigma24 family protein
MLDLDDAIESIRRTEPAYARMVELRLFGAMTNDEIARVLNVGLSTVEKDWRYVKAMLAARLASPGAG